MMLIDQVTLKNLLVDYKPEAILRYILDAEKEDAFLAAVAEAFRQKGHEEDCAGCKAAAIHLDMLASDDAKREFVTQEGAHCPNCFSTNTEGGSFDIEGGLTEQYQSCYDCEATWVAQSLLIGFRDLETEHDDV